MPFFSKDFSAALAPKERSEGGGYLNPSSIPDGEAIRMAILSEEPLEGFEVWFNKAEGGMTKRITPEVPDDALLAELAKSANATVAERDGKPAIKRCASFFVYDYADSAVKIFSATQATILRDLDRLCSDEDYGDLSQWDLKISRTGKGTDTKYALTFHPTKRSNEAVAKEVFTAWDNACKAGWSLEALLEGGNPFGGQR